MLMPTSSIWWTDQGWFNGSTSTTFISSCLLPHGFPHKLAFYSVDLSLEYAMTFWDKSAMLILHLITTKEAMWLLDTNLLEQALWTWNTGNNSLIGEDLKHTTMAQNKKIELTMDNLSHLSMILKISKYPSDSSLAPVIYLQILLMFNGSGQTWMLMLKNSWKLTNLVTWRSCGVSMFLHGWMTYWQCWKNDYSE